MATVEQQKALAQTLDPDLAGLLQTKDVSLKVQALVAQKKVKTISRLSAMADDRKGIREFCVKTLGLEASVGDDLVEIASVVDAWESARSRVDARNKAEGEADPSAAELGTRPRHPAQHLPPSFASAAGWPEPHRRSHLLSLAWIKSQCTLMHHAHCPSDQEDAEAAEESASSSLSSDSCRVPCGKQSLHA